MNMKHNKIEEIIPLLHKIMERENLTTEEAHKIFATIIKKDREVTFSQRFLLL